ncbi:DUF6090 family protein [Robiginitalea sp. IMCC44478]|uniref:DUF6090 family protein n=1 Tax=Robiginitalea sp. IMCC44478 TaxID=3459122 RepID=UPI0040430066
MISFFRQLRKSLLTSNKFRKYLLYAVGEILLVVIGILIALQVNNWNEDRILNRERINILQNLRTDLANDIANYKTNIYRLQQRQEIADDVLQLLEDIPSEIDSAETARKLLILGYIEDHNPSFATYNEIQGSGKLGLLESNELKTALANYRSAFEDFKTIGNNWNEDIKDYERIISGFFSGNIPLQNYEYTDKTTWQNDNLRFSLGEISANDDLVSRIRHIAYFTKIQIDIKQNVLLPICEDLIAKIDEELE